MISNEQRAHDIAIALMKAHGDDLKPIDAYHQYVNYLLPILREINKDFPTASRKTPNYMASNETNRRYWAFLFSNRCLNQPSAL